jgi:hypothetical protein
MSTYSRSFHRTIALAGIGAVIHLGAMRPAAAQDADAASVLVRWTSPQSQNVPQDVRIMRTIVSTALSEVEAPELPEDLAGDSVAERRAPAVVATRLAYSASSGSSFFRRGDVSGFYMEGYGYLFTVHWPVSSMVALNALATEWVHREGVLSQEARSGPSAQWAAQYRQLLSDALRDVIAGYGSTLRRAGAGESITFIADFGGGDAETVTMTVRADALRGSDVEANRGAIQVSEGQAGVSERMRTQLKIMSQIIDTSLRPGDTAANLHVSSFGAYFGGSAEAQHVPGYGVIFRKNGRMSTARAFASVPTAPIRATAVDSVETEARETYRQHLDTLRRRTVEILATYGPTLTELGDDDWVGIYYDVGSAATLLSGGTDNYLVQARMRDIRQATAEGDPTAWLAQRLVTNEREE